jgi:CRP-like cAMP-binding protein
MAAIPGSAVFVPGNTLLAALPEVEWERVRKYLRPILMTHGDVLHKPGVRFEYLYFPATSVVSIASMIAGGRKDAVVLVGHEGFVGIEAVLGGDSATRCAVVQSEGWAYQIRQEWLHRECERRGPMQDILLRYTQSYMTQVAQTAACNRHHSIDQQFCRWLLMFLDCQESSDLAMTHERIAALMGVRREGVTDAAGRLQFGGSIRCRRGHIYVVDRAKLETHSCECYGVVKREAERLIGITQRHTHMTAALAATDRVGIGRTAYMNNAPSTNCA